MSRQDLYEQLRRKPQIRAVCEQLLEARREAEALELDVWTFAVEMFTLFGTGCTVTQLRVLVWAGYVEHAEEVTKRSDRARSFRPESQMKFGQRSCFVLTEAGFKFLDGADSRSGRGEGDGSQPHGEANRIGMMQDRKGPIWDQETRELRVGRRLVKRFTRPAPTLELVLGAFQEMDWAVHLDDPLPPEHGIDPQQRLHDTIKRLNRCQSILTVHFMGDGTGCGIRWEWAGERNRMSP